MALNFVLESEDYFMSVAFLTALRSKDTSTKVGACIVNEDNKIVGLGYNKSPGNVFIDLEQENQGHNWFQSKYPYVLHAEMDAILNKTCESLHDCTMYSLVLPYYECAKLIVESGITKLVYYVDKYSETTNKACIDASKTLFTAENIEYKQFKPLQDETKDFLKKLENQTVLAVPSNTFDSFSK